MGGWGKNDGPILLQESISVIGDWPHKQALLTKNRAHSRPHHRVNALHVRLADLKLIIFSDQRFTALSEEIGR
jgi:hypothetical protein